MNLWKWNTLCSREIVSWYVTTFYSHGRNQSHPWEMAAFPWGLQGQYCMCAEWLIFGCGYYELWLMTSSQILAPHISLKFYNTTHPTLKFSSGLNWLISWSRVCFGGWQCAQITNKVSVLYGSRIITAVFETARHKSLPWTRYIHSTVSHTTTIRFVSISFSYLLPGVPSGFLFKIFNDKSCMYFSPLQRALHAPRALSFSLVLLQIWSSSIWNYLQPPVNLSLLYGTILTSILSSFIEI